MLKDYVVADIGKHVLDVGDRILLKMEDSQADTDDRRVVAEVVGIVRPSTMGVEDLLTLTYEVRHVATVGAVSEHDKGLIQQSVGKTYQLKIRLDEPNIFEIRTQHPIVPPQPMSDERLVMLVYTRLMQLSSPYKARYVDIVAYMQGAGYLAKDEIYAKQQLSRAFKSDTGRQLIMSKGGHVRAITDSKAQVELMRGQTTSMTVRNMPDKILINFPQFTKGLRLLLDSISIVEVVD